MNKKGMAPLVATLLLIAFAVALGVVIMNFGRAQVEMEAQCTLNIGLKFVMVGGEEQFCLDREKKQLFFVVENGVNIAVEALTVNIIGTKQVKTYDLGDARIEKAGAHMRYVPYDVKEIGEPRQIKIVPRVIMYDEELFCQEKAIVVEKVRDC